MVQGGKGDASASDPNSIHNTTMAFTMIVITIWMKMNVNKVLFLGTTLVCIGSQRMFCLPII
jgi:hypothetical protein